MIMETQTNQTPRSQNPRRRKRTKLQIFKEAYLPTIILAITIVLILVFIIGGAVNRFDQKETVPPQHSNASSQPSGVSEPSDPSDNLAQEADDLLKKAALLAANYDYEGALAVLDGFSGKIADYSQLQDAYQQYTNANNSMVSWSASEVYNLSFHVLIADPNRAFSDSTYGTSYQRNFITTEEFARILQQLYENGYILVSLDDFYTQEYNSTSGKYVFTETQLKLPAGKKPVMLTETNANYYTYMVDSNGDGKPDAGADGFACRLVYDGYFYNELVNADGSISTGAYDLVPILENFISANPSFSYRGARATIAFSGYDRVLGYRINAKSLSASALQAERDGAAAIAKALREAGYDLACYTYQNVNYSTMDADKILSDITKWNEKVTPWLGEMDILVFAWEGDIGNTEMYSGSKFNVLYNAGFRYFLGSGSTPWNQVSDLYVRHNRLSVTGSNLKNHADWFASLFDPATVLDSSRP